MKTLNIGGLSLILSLSSYLYSQPAIEQAKADYNILLGASGCNSQQTVYYGTTANYTGNVLDFQDNTSCTEFGITNSSISDKEGNLLFYTNGTYIYDRLNQNLMSPDRNTLLADTAINPGWANMEHGNYGRSYKGGQGALFLPHPADTNQYYLLHMSVNNYSNTWPYIYSDKFYYTLVDKRLNNGLGGLISMNNVLDEGNNIGAPMLTACRHANGRDWWIGYWARNGFQYYSYLLDPTGLHRQPDQTFQGNFQGAWGNVQFSPDGTKYAFVVGKDSWSDCLLGLFDFDRCTGQLNLRYYSENAPYYYAMGLAFSANSRFLYLSSMDYIWQYDTDQANFENSRIGVAHYDGFTDILGYATNFQYIFLAPDNKMYIMPAQPQGNYITVINAPDNAGMASLVIQRQIQARTFYPTLPNFPNFRLGALSGSACDTLDFNVAVTPVPSRDNEASISALVYPNPTASNLTIAYALPEQGEVSVVNALGQVLYERVLAKGDDKLWLNVEDWANGVYFVRLSTPNSGVYSKKVFVLH